MMGLIAGVPFVWKAVAGLVLVGLVGGYILILRADNAGLRADVIAAERDAAIYAEANKRTTESFNRYIAETERTQQILAATAETANQRAVDHARLQAEIDNVPTQNDCPVAPVLDHALDGLQHLRTGEAAGD